MNIIENTLVNLYLKNDVKINGAHFYPEVAIILQVARETAPDMTDGAIWITSANDGSHMVGSKHYSNQAFDLRVRNIVGFEFSGGAYAYCVEAANWVNRMREKLGPDYDIIYGSGGHLSHIHVEFDKKGE